MVMNKRVVLSMNLPISIRNRVEKTVIIALNEGYFMVCKYQANKSVYLNDTKLRKWIINLPDFVYAFLSVSYKM